MIIKDCYDNLKETDELLDTYIIPRLKHKERDKLKTNNED